MTVQLGAVSAPSPCDDDDGGAHSPPQIPLPSDQRPDKPRNSRRRWYIATAFLVAIAVSGCAAVRHARLHRRRSLAPGRPRVDRDSRPVVVRAALSAIDLRRRPPLVSVRPAGLGDALRALRRPLAPRALPYVAIKRTNPQVGDTFGHWWIEIDGTESYGWWPERCPIRVRDFFFGSRGTINGMGGSCVGGSTMTDPHHLEPAEHLFHPILTVRKSDRRVRREIRAFAQPFTGEWRWSTKPSSNDCRTFQLRHFDAVGLREATDDLHTRGHGCPFLALFTPRVRTFAAGSVDWE